MRKRYDLFISDSIPSYSSQRGVVRSFHAICDGMANIFGERMVVCSPHTRAYGKATYMRSLQNGEFSRIRLHDYVASIASAFMRPAVFYSSYYGTARVNAPEVFTVYDMIYELLPVHFPRNIAYNKKFIAEKKACIERAAALIAISQSTADDIMSIYPNISKEKINVVYLGVKSSFFNRDIEKQIYEGKPFFLYVGHRGGYKNFYRFLLAFGKSGLAQDFNLRVISPISNSLSTDEKEVINNYQLSDSIQLVTKASEAELQASYANAAAFVYPSEYEGFGLPLLEAMASGTIVATSQTSSLSEIGGDIALYFNPYDVESIVVCLRDIAAMSNEERTRRILAGIMHARSFTWDRCIDQFASIIKRFI